MKKKMLLAGFIGCFLLTSPVDAGQIVAIVNDEPISRYDVEARAKLIAVQRAEYLSDKRKAQYVKEALDDVIDDKIKIAEAKRYNLTVTDKEVAQAIAHLEQQNGLAAGKMKNMLAKNGVPLRILEEQITADLMWVQVLQRRQGGTPSISQAEIDKKKSQLRQKLREEEFFVFEILVPKKEDAEKCYAELQKGVEFDQVVQKYSRSETAKTGGEVGWIKNNYYSPEITAVLRQMNIGDLSVPLKTDKGYLLVLLQDVKKPILTDTIDIWEMAQMAMPTRQAIQFEKEITALKTCKSFSDFAQKYAIPESVKTGAVSPEQLPSELKEILQPQPVQKLVGPIRAQDTDIFFMKCSVSKKNVLPDDDIIKTQIENDKMEALSEKLLKNAKRFVVVEYK